MIPLTLIRTLTRRTIHRVKASRDLYVVNLQSPRREEKFSTYGRNETSEESNETAEEIFSAYVEIEKKSRGNLRFPT